MNLCLIIPEDARICTFRINHISIAHEMTPACILQELISSPAGSRSSQTDSQSEAPQSSHPPGPGECVCRRLASLRQRARLHRDAGDSMLNMNYPAESYCFVFYVSHLGEQRDQFISSGG